MAFREVRVFEVREVLRLWLRGEGVRATERLVGVDRKTVRRYRGRRGRARSGPRRRRGAADRRVHRVGGGGGAPAPPRRARRGVAAAGRQPRPDRGVAEDRRADGGEGRTSCWPGAGSWCRSGRCTATRWRCAMSAVAGGARRCGSTTASRATSCRSTSVGWVWCSTRRRGRQPGVHALIFTPVVSRCTLRVADVPPDDRGGDRRVRGGVGVLRRRVRDGDPRQPVGDRRRGRCARAAVEPGVRRVRAGPRVRDRPGPGALAAGQAAGGAAGAVRAQLVLRRRDLRRSRRRATPGRGLVPRAGRAADPRHDPAAPRRGVRASRSSRGCGRRRPALYDVPIYATGEGPSRPSHRGRPGALLGPGRT